MQCLVLLMNNLKNPNCFEKAEARGQKIKIMGLTDKLSNEVGTKPICLLTDSGMVSWGLRATNLSI